jgi:hypothetical protein
MTQIATALENADSSDWVKCPDRAIILRTGGVYGGATLVFESAVIDSIDNDTGIITVIADTIVTHLLPDGSDPSYATEAGAEKIEALTNECAMRVTTSGGGGTTAVNAWAFTQRFG